MPDVRGLLVTALGSPLLPASAVRAVMWRLSVELRHGHAFSENAEQHASRIGGALLFVLAAYVVLAAGWNLWTRHGEEFSLPGLILTILAIPIMRYLARRKVDLAYKLGSRA